MSSDPRPSLAASLWALLLACITAGVVHWGDRTPWQAMVIVGVSALALSLVGALLLLLLARRRTDRAELWKLFRDTARADLQPFVVLWRLIRGRRP